MSALKAQSHKIQSLKIESLKIESLSLRLPDGIYLCRDLSFTIEPGSTLALMGHSGSGKSSILNWITGTLHPAIQASGQVFLGTRNITELAVEHRGLGLMLQQDYLFPHMSVGQNLKFGLLGGSKAQRDDIVKQSLRSAGLDDMAHRDPATLSGGQRARVSLLRTLLSNPHALLLDEPFSRLDTHLRTQIREFTWASAAQLPILLVTHDADDIPQHAEVVVLESDALNPKHSSSRMVDNYAG